MKTSTCIALLVWTISLVGCAAQNNKDRMLTPPEPTQRVDKVAILSMPSAINLDNTPGPDGLKVQAMLFQADRAEPVLTNGTMQFLLYEGRTSPPELRTLQPSLTWTYSGAKLDRHRSRSMFGWGYAVELRWGARKPKSGVISLAVRYVPAEGPSVYSSPIHISLR